MLTKYSFHSRNYNNKFRLTIKNYTQISFTSRLNTKTKSRNQLYKISEKIWHSITINKWEILQQRICEIFERRLKRSMQEDEQVPLANITKISGKQTVSQTGWLYSPTWKIAIHARPILSKDMVPWKGFVDSFLQTV